MALLTAIVLSFASAFVMVLFVNWLDRYEKEPLLLMLAAFLWGVVIAAGGAYVINTMLGIGVYVFTGDDVMADISTVVVFAPFVEEFLKGLAVLIVFFLFRREFDSILDGIIYAALVALGLCRHRDAIYIVRGYDANGWAGLLELADPPGGGGLAASLLHGLHGHRPGGGAPEPQPAGRCWPSPVGFLAGGLRARHAQRHGRSADLLGRLTDWLGWIVMGGFIVWMILHERGLMQKHLAEEVTSGLLTPGQYQSAMSPLTMSFAIFSGLATHRFYQTCGELAHKNKGNSPNSAMSLGNTAIIASLRAQLASLRPQVGG